VTARTCFLLNSINEDTILEGGRARTQTEKERESLQSERIPLGTSSRKKKRERTTGSSESTRRRGEDKRDGKGGSRQAKAGPNARGVHTGTTEQLEERKRHMQESSRHTPALCVVVVVCVMGWGGNGSMQE